MAAPLPQYRFYNLRNAVTSQIVLSRTLKRVVQYTSIYKARHVLLCFFPLSFSSIRRSYKGIYKEVGSNCFRDHVVTTGNEEA